MKYVSGWKYDNNNALSSFTPRSTDILVAAVNFTSDTITDLRGQTGAVYGIAKGYAGGNLTFKADWWNGVANDGEFGVTGSFVTPHPAGNVLTYLHGDHLGSASLATNASGDKVSELRYYPYGETRSGSLPTDRRFTGQRYEAGLGVYDYNARYYDPALGRFLAADSIVPSPGNPQSLNRYSYVLNNPLRYTDPSGHKACESFDAAGRCIPEVKPPTPRFWPAFRGNWSETGKRVVQGGTAAIGHALAGVMNEGLHQDNLVARKNGEPLRNRVTPRQAFYRVYGRITLRWCGTSDNCGIDANAWAWAYSAEEIRFQGMYSDAGSAARFVTHELGHVFDRAVSARSDLAGKTGTCGDSADCLGRSGYDSFEGDYWGFAGGMNNWQFARLSDTSYAGEIFADMFVGWVNNTWGDSTRGTYRQTYMNEQMSHYLTTNFSQP